MHQSQEEQDEMAMLMAQYQCSQPPPNPPFLPSEQIPVLNGNNQAALPEMHSDMTSRQNGHNVPYASTLHQFSTGASTTQHESQRIGSLIPHHFTQSDFNSIRAGAANSAMSQPDEQYVPYASTSSSMLNCEPYQFSTGASTTQHESQRIGSLIPHHFTQSDFNSIRAGADNSAMSQPDEQYVPYASTSSSMPNCEPYQFSNESSATQHDSQQIGSLVHAHHFNQSDFNSIRAGAANSAMSQPDEQYVPYTSTSSSMLNCEPYQFSNESSATQHDSQQIGSLVHAQHFTQSDLNLMGARTTVAMMPQQLHQGSNEPGEYPPHPPPLGPPLILNGQGLMANYSNQSSIGSMSEASSSIVNSSTQVYQPTDYCHATSLAIQSDNIFLDPVHIFLRRESIHLFVATQDDMTAPGRGSRPSKEGQVGLRCAHCMHVPRQEVTKQACCFPSKRENIFESIRNFQRSHLSSCPYIPEEMKARYNLLVRQHSSQKKPQKYVRAYYAEAASEIGLVDSPNGLVFGALPNTTGMPSERLAALSRAADSPATSYSFWATYSPQQDEAIKMKKFEDVASGSTRAVIVNARREPSYFVRPQDFPTISDIDYLTYHQITACRPSAARIEQKGLSDAKLNALAGLCCKHCARANAVVGNLSSKKGVYFPTSLAKLTDSSFSQTILTHLMSCKNVPKEIKDAFAELKQLAANHGVTTKRGSKKRFFEKVWERMVTYFD